MWDQLIHDIKDGDTRALARSISLVENEAKGFEKFLQSLPSRKGGKVIGITGSPGAGKSTLVDALLDHYTKENKKTAVCCIDPSSPFHHGALLGDRIRMSKWYNHPAVFIRSLASRGSLGGLHPHIIEITDILQAADFDQVIIETVGVGQSEIEITGLADITLLVLVPEGGDEIQTMKAGIMEIADIFVVNKSDRPGADAFVANLQLMLMPSHYEDRNAPILKTVAATGEGIEPLARSIDEQLQHSNENKISWLLTERAWQLIRNKRMQNIDKELVHQQLQAASKQPGFNLYSFVDHIDKT
ncbi:MAG TPA: methylmalonyl Co-A mutase-associated GTPase MeaB [Flavitalea sp.]|nr:methylmalonyl Co-A mutase-associated GTPase MeaB [Flavitalea sp.]